MRHSSNYSVVTAKGRPRTQSPASRDTDGATDGVGQRQGGISGNVEESGLIRLSTDFRWFGFCSFLFFFLLIRRARV